MIDQGGPPLLRGEECQLETGAPGDDRPFGKSTATLLVGGG